MIMTIFDDLYAWLKNWPVTKGIYTWIKETICGGNALAAKIVSVALVVIVLALIIWFIVALFKGGKKNKKEKTQEAQVVEAPVKEKESTPAYEEKKVEEIKTEVPAQEEKVEDVKEEPIQEEIKPQVVEEVKEEAPVAKEIKPVEKKKTPSKKVVKTKKEEVEEAPAIAEPVATEKVMTDTTTLRSKGKYEVYPVNDVFMYHLKASNGEILVTSEIYKSAKGAVAAIDTIIRNVETGEIVINKDKHNMFQFKLFAPNKRLIAASANYPTETRCQSAAESFKKFAIASPVVMLDEDPDRLMEKIEITEREDKKGGKIVVEHDGTYSFKLLANNGAIICSSEEYKTKAGSIKAIDSLKDAIQSGTFYVVRDKRDMYQFKLYSATGRVVVYGETYKNKAQACSAANSVFSFINTAEVVDKTIAEEVK